MKRGLGLLFLLFAVGLALLWMQRDSGFDDPQQPAHAQLGAQAPLATAQPPIAPLEARAAREAAPTPDAAPKPETASETAAPVLEADDSPDIVEEDAPPDEEIEAGECALDLGVYDANNAAPVPGGVDLWRLAVPGTPVWVAGDQRQAQVQLVDGRARFEHLPAGRYRVGVHERRIGAPDPPEFQVRGPSTRVDLSVEMPRRFRVLLDVRDESGLPLNQALMHVPTGSMSIAAPDWSQRRVLRSGKSYGELAAVEWGSSDKTRPVFAGGQGFEIGDYMEATPRNGGSRHVLLEFDGRSSVNCPVLYSGKELARLLAVSIPIQRIAERLRTQDGVALEMDQVAIEARCTAVDVSALAEPLDWREVQIRIRVVARGYKDLVLEHKLSQGQLPELILERP